MTILNHGPYKEVKQVGAEAWDRSRARVQATAAVLAAVAMAAGMPVWAQDVAEAARQAKKNKQNNGLKHVYTDEDLKHKKILTPEDRETLDAKKNEQPAPGATASENLDAENVDVLPLGDVARMYRALKEFHSQTGDFHLPASEAVLAAPRVSPDFAMRAPSAPNAGNAAAPSAPSISSNVNTAAPAFSGASPAAPKAAHQFGIAKPHASRAAQQTVPVAPQLSNGLASVGMSGATGATFSGAAMVAPPAAVAAVAPTVAATPVAATSSVMPEATPAASREFIAPRPNAVEPSVHAIPTAPVFGNSAAPLTIVVKRGDSFWKLAQINLGDGHRWHELLAVNPSITDPNHLVPGTVLKLGVSVPEPMIPAGADEKITVRKGDSLWRIAATKLGFGGFWGCIAKANPVIKDANLIYTGQTLNVPAACEDKR
jgi:nucleoid-associated protein YgaU